MKPVAVLLLVFVLASLAIMPGFAAAPAGPGNPNPGILPPNSNPFGKSYVEWSIDAWKQSYEAPNATNPLLDTTGALCGPAVGDKVWHLVGSVVGEYVGPVVTIVRDQCVVPVGKAIFILAGGNSCSTIEPPPSRGETDAEVLACEQGWWDSVPFSPEASVIIDGKPVQNMEQYRFRTGLFDVSLEDPTADNWYGADCSVDDCEHARAAGHNYALMLAPLPKGPHTIRMLATWRLPETGEVFFGWDVTYNLTVR